MIDRVMSHVTMSKMLVADVLERWPETSDVFNRHATACVGCVLAPFCTVMDAAASYHLPPEQLVDELMKAIAAHARS